MSVQFVSGRLTIIVVCGSDSMTDDMRSLTVFSKYTVLFQETASRGRKHSER
jgi:hypothetical protein